VVRALAATRQRDAVPDLIAAWSHETTRDAAFTGLLDLPDIRALDVYLAGLASPQAAQRDKSRAALTKLAPELWPRLKQRTEPLPAAAIAPLRRILAAQPEALASPLLAESGVARPAHSVEDYRAFALANAGDAPRGLKLFTDTRTGCANCHVVAGQGQNVGPDLTTIGAQFGRETLIEAILYPSKSIREGYQQVEIELKDGESLTGAIRGESPETLVLVDALGRVQTVPKSTVKGRTAMVLSLMPEGLQAALTREEFADIIAYLVSLKTDPRRSPANPN
jgi:putative heme-binding domain-containing protein